jgi:murein L,D-transpeptidase YafK
MCSEYKNSLKVGDTKVINKINFVVKESPTFEGCDGCYFFEKDCSNVFDEGETCIGSADRQFPSLIFVEQDE